VPGPQVESSAALVNNSPSIAIAWDWVRDLQTALNERGFSLAIDGEYSPRTSDAVAAVEQEIDAYPVDGEVDPEVADALGLQAPANAMITQLEAGYPGSC